METLTLRPNEAPVIGSRYSAVTGSRPCKLHPAIRMRRSRDRFVTLATRDSIFRLLFRVDAVPRRARRFLSDSSLDCPIVSFESARIQRSIADRRLTRHIREANLDSGLILAGIIPMLAMPRELRRDSWALIRTKRCIRKELLPSGFSCFRALGIPTCATQRYATRNVTLYRSNHTLES